MSLFLTGSRGNNWVQSGLYTEILPRGMEKRGGERKLTIVLCEAHGGVGGGGGGGLLHPTLAMLAC